VRRFELYSRELVSCHPSEGSSNDGSRANAPIQSSIYEVHCYRVAAWVWLDHLAGVVGNFDENGFWISPGHKKEIGFKVKRDSTNGGWVADVTVRSLWNNTQ
jgi:hypothetical protein